MFTRARLLTYVLLFVLASSLPAWAAPPKPQPNPIAPNGSGSISGQVFMDFNGDGFPIGESGVANASLKLLAQGTGALLAQTTTGPGGFYEFLNLNDGAYLVVLTPPQGTVSTTPNTAAVTISFGGQFFGVSFGVAPPGTIMGVVFQDANLDGMQGPLEPGIGDALVELFEDTNGDSQLDPGDRLLASTITASGIGQGSYSFTNVAPGRRILRVTPPGALSSQEPDVLNLVSSEVGGFSANLDVAVLDVSAGPASLSGTIWHDRNGNEFIDPEEPPLPNVQIELYADPNTNRAVDPGERLVATTTANSMGQYALGGLAPGNYVLLTLNGTLPASWVPSQDASALGFSLTTGLNRVLNVGYYDPLTVGPLSVGDWKKEVKQQGKPHYTPAEVSQFIAIGQASSLVFPEIVSLEDALLKGAGGDEGHARKEYAALRLNLASNRLLAKTPVNLPDLTTRTTVGQVAKEIEALLTPPSVQTKKEYERARKLAGALNDGKGIGYGLQGMMALVNALWKGTEVASKLRPGGDYVDLRITDGYLWMWRWSPGSLNSTTNVFDPRLRVRVIAFYDDAVLEARQMLPDGREVSLGMAVPTIWNKDIKATYTFDLWRMSTVAQLVSADLRLYVFNRNSGTVTKREHIKIDSAKLIFAY
jgi:hypothetical protein